MKLLNLGLIIGFISTLLLCQITTIRGAQTAVSATRILKCPDFTQKGNFSDPAILKQQQDKFWDKLWSYRKPSITPKIAWVRNYLRRMAFSGHDLWRNYAFLTSQWFWFFAPLIKSNINLCPYARFINASVDFASDKNCNKLKKALSDVMAGMFEAMEWEYENTIENLGCQPDEQVQKSVPDCPGNGFQYKMKEMWDLEGEKIPGALRRLIEELDHSHNVLDKLIQLCLTANLSPPFRSIINNTGYTTQFTFFNLMMNTKLPRGCCEDFKKQCNDNLEDLQSATNFIFKKAMEEAGC